MMVLAILVAVGLASFLIVEMLESYRYLEVLEEVKSLPTATATPEFRRCTDYDDVRRAMLSTDSWKIMNRESVQFLSTRTEPPVDGVQTVIVEFRGIRPGTQRFESGFYTVWLSDDDCQIQKSRVTWK